MKYDIMQIERMESGGHRIEVRNEKRVPTCFTRTAARKRCTSLQRVLAGG